MTAPSFWEVLDRAWNTGAPTKTRDFDMKIFTEASRLAEEHDISYDPEVYIPCDDGLADAVWDAGVELFTEVGMYCVNTRRVMRFDKSEVKDALRKVRDNVEIGEGGQRRVVTRRGIEGSNPPVIIGGVIESDLPEGENFVKLYQSIAQEPSSTASTWGPPFTRRRATNSGKDRPWRSTWAGAWRRGPGRP